MAALDSLTSQHRSRHKIVILSALVQKLWSKTEFCKMVDNVKGSGMSHVQTA